MTLLLVTAVAAEAEAIGDVANARVVVAGIGRTNAAAATTEGSLEGSVPSLSTFRGARLDPVAV